MKLALAGESYTNRAIASGAQECLNLYAETIEDPSGSGKSTRILRGTPGQHVLANLNAHAGNVRGLWSGGGRCFVCVGNYYYEINQSGGIVTGSTRLLPTTSDGNPVQFFGNGNQLGIIADGYFLIDNGDGAVKARFQLNGTVTVSGTAVTWASGDVFTPEIAGIYIFIDNQVVFVSSRASTTAMTLRDSFVGTGSGTGVLDWQGLFYWASGDLFTDSMVKMPIIVGGTEFKIESVDGSRTLKLAPPTPLTEGEFFPGWSRTAVAWSITQTAQAYSAAAGDPVTAVTGAYLDGSFYVQRPSTRPTTYTDLVINGADNTKVTSAAHPFDSTFVGYLIVVSGGTGFTAGSYQVMSVTTGVATLSSAVGTISSTGGLAVGYPAADLGRTVNFSGFANDGVTPDGTIWNGLDFVSKEGYPDYIQTIFADREQLYIFGTESGEVWQNDLNTGRLVRIQGTMVREGNPARYGVVSMLEHVYFIGGSPGGSAIAYRLDGFSLTRISTHAVEEAWATNGANISTVISYWYQDDGHAFWVIRFPGSVNAWVYDATEKFWHERADWSGSAFTGHRVAFHTYIPEWSSGSLAGVHVVGDATSAKVLIQSSTFYDDATTDTKRIRVAPYLYAGLGKRVYCDRLNLDMATGLIPSGSEPTVTLEWSNDNGASWSTPDAAGFGAAGETNKRVYWIAQGSAEVSMMPRFSITGQAAVTLIDLDAEVAYGTS